MNRKTSSHRPADRRSAVAAPKFRFRELFEEKNRGLLLDVLVFVANILVMRFLTRLYIDLFSEVSAENPLAKLALGLTFLAMWILPAAGAVLKRLLHWASLQASWNLAGDFSS